MGYDRWRLFDCALTIWRALCRGYVRYRTDCLTVAEQRYV